MKNTSKHIKMTKTHSQVSKDVHKKKREEKREVLPWYIMRLKCLRSSVQARKLSADREPEWYEIWTVVLFVCDKQIQPSSSVSLLPIHLGSWPTVSFELRKAMFRNGWAERIEFCRGHACHVGLSQISFLHLFIRTLQHPTCLTTCLSPTITTNTPSSSQPPPPNTPFPSYQYPSTRYPPLSPPPPST